MLVFRAEVARDEDGRDDDGLEDDWREGGSWNESSEASEASDARLPAETGLDETGVTVKPDWLVDCCNDVEVCLWIKRVSELSCGSASMDLFCSISSEHGIVAVSTVFDVLLLTVVDCFTSRCPMREYMSQLQPQIRTYPRCRTTCQRKTLEFVARWFVLCVLWQLRVFCCQLL